MRPVGNTLKCSLNKTAIRLLAVYFMSILACGTTAWGLEISLERPGEREFIRDQAKLIDSDGEESIMAICDALLTEKATPVIVVTIESMTRHGGSGMRIETFSTLLFNQWEIGHAKLGEQDWNTGILLLVSRDDRQARIELGAGWGHREDAQSRQIMDEHIIYHFKQGQFSAGIVAGVTALDKMARKLELPTQPRPWWHFALVAGFIGLAIFTIVSLIKRGASGWAWLFWGAVFTLVGFLLMQMLKSKSGGFGGGSFGGGFSGGGGASGSW